MRDDDQAAFPLTDRRVAVLLWPEVIIPESTYGSFEPIDVKKEPYAEAYAEMAFYDKVAREEARSVSTSSTWNAARMIVKTDGNALFLEPKDAWINATHDSAAQRAAYLYLGDVAALESAQLGGMGLDAVKFALAGASRSWLVSPIPGELECANEAAREFGVASRMAFVAGVAEEIPLADALLDRVYCGGTLHHMVTDSAFPEIARVLRPGGRFASIDPWRAPLYGLGIRIFGKREPEVHCRPLDPERVSGLQKSFPDGKVSLHGALTRYPILALSKMGVPLSPTTIRRIAEWDDKVTKRLPAVRQRLGSSSAVLGSRRVS